MNDTNSADKKFQKELNSGTVALVLLGVLGRAREPMYGYEIAKHVESITPEVPMMKQGAFYPVLRSLEGSGLLESRVEPSVTGPPRRYYVITQPGREALGRWAEIWRRIRSIVDTTLKGPTDD